jgi:hypothetical protein
VSLVSATMAPPAQMRTIRSKDGYAGDLEIVKEVHYINTPLLNACLAGCGLSRGRRDVR